ncbi:FAD-dependent oxidoreductase [Parapedobacter indicus]|nr:FAD-dependent oxidoreductase [Parapedobacter indicus]
MMRFKSMSCLLLIFQLDFSSYAQTPTHSFEADVCIYGATPSGITAAIAAADEGNQVLIVEPSRWAGGILAAGLKPIQDCPNFEAVGGITRDLLLTLGMGDIDPKPTEKDVREAIGSYMSPKVLQDDFRKLLTAHQIPIVYEHRVSEVEKDAARINRVWFDLAPPDSTGCPIPTPTQKRNLLVRAKIFIDASYEGDLMAEAGVSYRTGRESSDAFGESLAGVRPPIHLAPIDPYKIPGDETSGLLPLVVADHGKPVGSADPYTQAYNFRFYLTDQPAYRAPIASPKNYDPSDFELIGRYVTYVTEHKPADSIDIYLNYIFPGWRNSNDYNYQRASLFTMAPLAVSQEYADGDYAKKAEIWKYHQDYLSGVYTFLTTDARVPEKFRKKTAQLGFDKRHFPDTYGWPQQLYVRITRRLDGNYTVTQNDVYNKHRVNDPIGLAQYGIDTYPSRRFVLKRGEDTFVAAEGNMFVGGATGPTKIPYQIPYNAIVPKKSECTNLLVPVCFSATHVGYASARMEPVFMILGESAGIAASQALRENVRVQDIEMKTYLAKLRAKGQRLEWPVD